MSTTTVEEDRPRLVFPWQRTRKPDWRSAFFIFVSLLLHAFAFYLLQVSYPPVQRVTPMETRVSLLHPADPGVARLLRKIDDATITLGISPEAELAEFSLSGNPVSFQPSFRNHRIQLKKLSLPEDAFDLPGIFTPGEVVFPEPEPAGGDTADAPVKAAAPRFPSAPEVIFQGSLAAREPEVMASLIPRPVEAETGRARIRVSAGRGGVLEHVLVEDEPPGGLPPDFGSRLRQAVRFSPAESVEWGWMEIYW